MKNVAFTICAKNYLAQAFTLKESFKIKNPNCDFFIFLSDDLGELTGESTEFILLDDSWISNWKQMAFKYNVIEFSTSIKPFCFNKLFKDGYEKVIYLDPDIYVTNPLDEIYGYLDQKSIVLTPHYCNIQTEYSGSITEEEILFVGIYNLGFTAVSNNLTGNKIIDWWMNRLADKCYADKFDALHVDQKWMDFIPAFFPNDSLITHHMGINPAIWNLHERELVINQNEEFQIKNIETQKLFPLLFFHFSGFDPFKPKLINRRHPKYNTDVYPSYIPLFDEYIKSIYDTGYERFSKMSYSFNSFSNGENIIPLHRRLFRSYDKNICIDPFNVNENFYNVLKKNRLLTGAKFNSFSTNSANERSKKGTFEKLVIKSMIIIKTLIGIRYYQSFLFLLNDFTRLERQNVLLKK